MRAPRLAALLLIMLTQCGAPAEPLPLPPPGPPVGPPAADLGLSGAAPDRDSVPDMGPPPYLPSMPGLPPPGPDTVYTAPSTASPSFAPGLPAGPVTNYGAGGMQALPGAPPNAPYPAGGLMH